MELHQLQYFVKVAELGSFTRAAEQCLVSQPSLSQQIIKLEKELGQPLFERLGRKVLLTDAGRASTSRHGRFSARCKRPGICAMAPRATAKSWWGPFPPWRRICCRRC